MYRLLNALCQICAFSLDLNGYSKEFMFGSSWAVSRPFEIFEFTPADSVQFVAAGPIFVLPIIRYWLKDTNMQSIEAIEVTMPQTEQSTHVEKA